MDKLNNKGCTCLQMFNQNRFSQGCFVNNNFVVYFLKLVTSFPAKHRGKTVTSPPASKASSEVAYLT